MIPALHIILFLFAAYIFYKYRARAILMLPVYVVIFDVIYGFYQAGSGFGWHRNFVLLCFVLYLSVHNRKVFYLNGWLNIFLAYLFILVPFSSYFKGSITGYVTVFVSMFCFPLGFYYIRNIQDLKVLNNSMIYLAVIFCLNGLVTSVFNLGIDYYGGNFSIGGFVASKLFSASVFLVLLPIILPLVDGRRHKAMIIAISVILFIFLILSMRRTAIFIPLFGYLLYFVYSKQKALIIFTAMLFLVALVFLFPFYQDALNRQFRARSETFEDPSLENEYRYRESIIILDETFSTVKTALIGKELFNSEGNYNDGMWQDRPIHIDYNLILYGSGLIGLILYLLVFVDILIKYYSYHPFVPATGFFHELKTIFRVLLILIMVISLNGGMTQVSYRSVIFLYLGGILGIFNKYYEYHRRSSEISTK